jgi:hypothetical protein
MRLTSGGAGRNRPTSIRSRCTCSEAHHGTADGRQLGDFLGRLIWYLAAGARQFFQPWTLRSTAPWNVRVLKEVLRWSATLAGVTAGVPVVLDGGPTEEL